MMRLRAQRNVRRTRFSGAFTLIELMVVVSIMAIAMMISVPIVYKLNKREALNRTVRSVVEVCSHARARAILSGQMTELVFYPREKRCQVSGGTPPPRRETEDGGFDRPETAPPPPPMEGLSAQIPETIGVEMLDVNLIEYKDEEMARVRFYPNGTCDEFTLVLRSDKGEWIKIWTEITTALANVGPVDR